MSTASLVPETYGWEDDRPWEVAARVGWRHLLAEAAVRLRRSDGFSHARSLAFASALISIQGLIALVGAASVFGGGGFAEAVQRGVQAAAPGPVGRALGTAVDQARTAGRSGNVAALVLGVAGSVVTATTAMGQVQRSLNRLYGIEQDRPRRTSTAWPSSSPEARASSSSSRSPRWPSATSSAKPCPTTR